MQAGERDNVFRRKNIFDTGRVSTTCSPHSTICRHSVVTCLFITPTAALLVTRTIKGTPKCEHEEPCPEYSDRDGLIVAPIHDCSVVSGERGTVVPQLTHATRHVRQHPTADTGKLFSGSPVLVLMIDDAAQITVHTSCQHQRTVGVDDR